MIWSIHYALSLWLWYQCLQWAVHRCSPYDYAIFVNWELRSTLAYFLTSCLQKLSLPWASTNTFNVDVSSFYRFDLRFIKVLEIRFVLFDWQPSSSWFSTFMTITGMSASSGVVQVLSTGGRDSPAATRCLTWARCTTPKTNSKKQSRCLSSRPDMSVRFSSTKYNSHIETPRQTAALLVRVVSILVTQFLSIFNCSNCTFCVQF